VRRGRSIRGGGRICAHAGIAAGTGTTNVTLVIVIALVNVVAYHLCVIINVVIVYTADDLMEGAGQLRT
jgi:hypothetical protein